MKKITLIFLLLPFMAVSQNLDSLWDVWQDKSQADTNRLKAISGYARSGYYLFTYPDSSFYFAQLQYNFAKAKQLKYYMADALNTQGISNSIKGDYPKALDCYFKSLTIKEEIGDKKGIGGTYSNIGNVYDSQGDYIKALEYYFKCLDIAEELDNKSSIGKALGNIGIVYYNQEKYSDALEYYFKSLEIKEELGEIHGMGVTYGNIGAVYTMLNEFDKALEYSIKHLEIAEELGDYRSVCIASGNIGGIYIQTKNYDLAESSLLKSLKIAQEIGAKNEEKNQHQQLSDLYEKTNRLDLALIHYKQFITLRDSIFSEENAENSMRTEMNHEYEKQQAVSDANHQKEMEKQSALAAEKNRRQQIISYSVGFGLLLVLAFLIFIYNRLKVAKRQKKIIEEKEFETRSQKQIIEAKHKEITDSINYAERLQRSLMSSKKLLGENLGDYFIYFNPKEAVSGDFYWSSHLQNGKFVLVCADSTGHGVPGSIMSMMNMNSLKEAVKEGCLESDEILNHTRSTIIETLANDGSTEGGKDGMDAALIIFNQAKTELEFSLANNPLWIMRSGELLEFKADKMPVGRHDKQDTLFTRHSEKLQKGDLIYIFTDGFADQFGGEKGKKFKYASLKELLISNHHKSLEEQNMILKMTFENWRGSLEQVDDVCVIGVRV